MWACFIGYRDVNDLLQNFFTNDLTCGLRTNIMRKEGVRENCGEGECMKKCGTLFLLVM